MPNLDSVTTPLHDLWNRATGAPPSTPPGASAPTSTPTDSRTRAELDAAYDKALDLLPTPSMALATVVARLDPIGAKLDQLKTRLEGPYAVGGATVYSGAQFRMKKGYNEGNLAASASRLDAVANKLGLGSQVTPLRLGRGDTEALIRVTQALIDEGELPAASSQPLPDQIHDLQWRYGIGLDCAGYVYKAVVALYGDPSKLGLKESLQENFTGLPWNSHFSKVAPTGVKAGDLLVLRDQPGHNLIVRSHSTAIDSSSEVSTRWPGAAPFLQGKTIHLFEVDSSFGAAESGRPDGGVRRDVLLYDAASKQWCTCRDTKPPWFSIDSTPYREAALTGFFRPKAVTR